MPRVKLFLTIDVADFDGCLTAHERALLRARVLAACHQSADSLTWAYKLVNTSVPPRAFEAALHDACTSSLTGLVCKEAKLCYRKLCSFAMSFCPRLLPGQPTLVTSDCRGNSPAIHTRGACEMQLHHV